MRRLITLFSMVLALCAGASTVQAAGTSNYPLVEVEIDSSMEARKRGAVIAIETCMMCHGFKYIKYRDLKDIGFTDDEVNDLRGDYEVEERLVAQMPVEDRKESYGMVPPDLTLMAIARKNGPRHIYTLLTTYYYDEEGNENNHLFPGIRMPDVFSSASAESAEEKAELNRQVMDVTAFMVWAADPNAEARRTLGTYVIIYLIILTTLLYLLKKKIWRRVSKVNMEEIINK